MSRVDAPVFTEGEPKPRAGAIFRGQGFQQVGMGEKLAKQFPEVAEGYKQADALLGYSISEISFRGPKETLDKTCHSQPAQFLDSHFSLVVSRNADAFRHNTPSITAGHSLGQYNAYVAAGVLNWRDALTLLDVRGRSMQHASEATPSKLVSLKNLGPNDEEVLTRLGFYRACDNTPDQLIWGGKMEAVAKATDIYGKRLRVLEVAGAFHTPFMDKAAEMFAPAVETVEFHEPRIPIVGNTTAKPLTEIQELKQELIDQINRLVQWRETQQYLDLNGFHLMYDVGEGGPLANMLKKTIGGVAVGAVAVGGITAAVVWRKHHPQA